MNSANIIRGDESNYIFHLPELGRQKSARWLR